MAETTLNCVKSWNLSLPQDDNAFGSSCTAGETGRVEGAVRPTATVVHLIDLGAALTIEPGDTDLLKLYSDNSSYWSLDALCTGMDTVADIESGAPVEVTYTFEGAVNFNDVQAAWTGTGAGPLTSKNGKVGWSS